VGVFHENGNKSGKLDMEINWSIGPILMEKFISEDYTLTNEYN
jgi:hypothetical protein